MLGGKSGGRLPLAAATTRPMHATRRGEVSDTVAD